jgi:hypothetical protein
VKEKQKEKERETEREPSSTIAALDMNTRLS